MHRWLTVDQHAVLVIYTSLPGNAATNGLRNNSPSIRLACEKSSLSTAGMPLSFAVAQICAS